MLQAVLVHSSAMTEHYKLDIYKQHNLFLTVIEVGKSEVKVPADSVSGSQAAVSPDGRKGRELPGASLIRGLAAFIRPNHLQKTPPPHTITLGTRIQHVNFRGTKTFRL